MLNVDGLDEARVLVLYTGSVPGLLRLRGSQLIPSR